MIVESAKVSMAGSSEAFSLTSTRTSAGVETKSVGEWLNELAPEDLGMTAATDEPVQLEISPGAQKAYQAAPMAAFGDIKQQMEDFQISLMQALYKMVTGKEWKIKLPTWQGASGGNKTSLDKAWDRYVKMNQGDTQLSGRLTHGAKITGNQKDLLNRDLKLDVVRRTETTYASEKMQFSMNAQVNTADGKSINVEINLSMSQEFYSRVDMIFAQNVKDPLVVNFGASSAALTQRKFNIDIDCDGTSDQISQLAAGSGFLAVDWDGSGTVKDGSQLFGTQSGNGFADLAKHDATGDGWIDENDPIFEKLRVWMWDDSGDSKLLTLGEIGIGAIYLGNVNTQYSLQQQGQAGGYIRSSGFFLKEDGTAGTVQHVDMVI